MNKPARIGALNRVLAIVAAIALMTAAFFVGAVILIVFSGVFTVALVAVRLRLWWLHRKFKRRPTGQNRPGRVIEGDYVAVRHRPNSRRRR